MVMRMMMSDYAMRAVWMSEPVLVGPITATAATSAAAAALAAAKAASTATTAASSTGWTTDGLSIGPRSGLHAQALHRGNDLFGSGPGTIDALRRARRRLRSASPLRSAADMVLDRARLRSSSVAHSEVSLAFQTAPRLRPCAGNQGGSAENRSRRRSNSRTATGRAKLSRLSQIC